MNQTKEFRELIRLLERKLGLLNKQKTCCSEVPLAKCHAIVEIGRAEKISLKELAAILGLDVSTMSRTVDHLVRENFALREASKSDRRSIEICLTENGKVAFNNLELEMDNKFKQIFELIPREDQEDTLKMLKTMTEAFSNFSRDSETSVNDYCL